MTAKEKVSDWQEVTPGEFWQPENVGDKVEGIYEGKTIGAFGDLYLLKTKDGQITLPSKTVLHTKFQNIKEGAEVQIEFLGEKQSTTTKGRKYQDFAVRTRT